MDEREQSLIDRATARLTPAALYKARVPRPAIEWRVATALAATMALGPLLTMVGAGVLERRARAETLAIAAQVSPQVAAGKADHIARERLRAAVRMIPVASWFDHLARVLPADARVAAMRAAGDGSTEIDILTPDPDPVRAALRRDRSFAGFRERGQRRAGAMILVTYRRTP